MRSMTFQVDDQSTGSAIPAVVVTITENADGSLSFTLNVVGSTIGDLRGFFFDLANESRIGTLSVTNTSAGFTQLSQGNDSVQNLGNGANMQELVGSDGGYDAGIEIGTAGIGRDDYQSFSFRLASSAGALTLDDFANVDFGVRLTSAGELGSRDGDARLLEHTTSAIDALNDANSITEDAAPNTASGNVFANDLHLGASHSVTNPGILQGTYGTLQLNADGSYTYTLNNGAVQFLAVGETRTESFAYTATASDEATSSSTDSAVLSITIAGSNDAPQITAAVAAGSVLEFAEDSPLETLGSHFVGGTVDFEDLDLSDVHGASVTPAASSYLGTLTAQVTDDSTGDGEGQVSWTYEVSDAAIEHLGLGDSLTQTYTIAVNDGHGGSDTQEVTITINGANDAPEIVAGNTNGDVFEDGSRSASGELVAIDIDQGSELSWSVTGSGPMTPRADYRFLIDNLNIVRSGLPFFNDDFGNGVPPPAGTSFGYFTFGTFLEAGGRVIMDGGLGAPSTIPGSFTVITHLATLNTDAGPDVTQGLKRGQDFKVEARYDLVMPADELGTYGVRLSDFADDIVEVDVRRLQNGSVAVALREVDVAGVPPVTRATIALEPAAGDNQIVLRLQHAADSNLVTASFDLLNGGVVTQTRAFTVAVDVFSNEDWTRAQIIGFSPATAQNGVYGTLSVETDGQWSYALNNRAANVQALAQHDHVTDTFTVRVTDEHGASDTQTVTVDVFGSNDAPIITAGDVNGFVQEDGFTSVTRQFTATDADHDHVLHWSVGPQTQVPLAGGGFQVFGYSSDYDVRLDQLKVVRNGATIFDDGFDPSAPSFPNGPGSNYLTNGAGFSEDDGRLVLDGSRANSARGIASPDLVVGHIAVLNTNTDSADLTRGLKSDDDFTVEARFDLFTPGVGQGYGLTLTDNTTNGLPPDQLGDDSVNLFVRADAAGNLSVQFSRFDIPADTVTVYQSRAFTPAAGENQIVLRLTHDADHRGIVHAEFDLVGGAGGPRTLSFTQTANIFGTSTPGYAGDDEEWTRAQVVAFGLDPYDADSDPTTHQGTYGSLSVQQNGEWTYALDNGSANVQALAQFQFAQDLFSIRVVDEYGMSSSRPAFISVQGSNDPVIAAGGDTSGSVREDTVAAASGTLAFTDVDLIDTHTAFFAPGGVFGTFSLGPVTESPLTPDVSVGWSYQLNSDTVQFLAQGESTSESFFVTAQDPWGGNAMQAVTVTITGTNDAPDITGGITTGLVYEDGGARTATGALTAADVDHGSTVFWTTLGGPLYGFATVNANGQWTYTLDNSRLETQQLAQGQLAFDSFTVRAFDEHGAFDPGSERVVTVTVAGTEDRPNLPPATLALSAFEDGGPAFVSTVASDVDNFSVLHWSLNRGSSLGYFSPYEFRADSFKIVKNGADLFFDDFTAGGPPPQAPNFLLPPPPGGSAETFYTTGGLLEEAGGKLVFSGASVGAFRGTGNNSLIVGNEAIVATNADPNPVTGLKRNHQFVVEGVFDLVDPSVVRQQYGIQLTDGVNQLADDLVILTVRRDDDGLFVRLSNNNSVLDTSNLVNRLPLVPGDADQIRLSLSHAANANTVTASYQLLDGGAVIGGGTLGQVAIFGADTPFPGDDNNWIRAGLIANALDVNEFTQTLAGTYGTLSVSNANFPTVGDLVYTPDTALPAVQALAHGETVTDSFFVRAVDQFGMSSSQRVDVTLNGMNDAPDITGGVATGLVYEDGGARVASGQLTAFDVDHGASVFWTTLGTPNYGTVTVNAAGQWTYTLDNTRFQTQQLAQGEIASDSFTVRAFDEHGAFDLQSERTVVVTIVGTDDRPNLPPTPLALSVSEDNGALPFQTGASDIDHFSFLHWSLNSGSALGYSSPYEFSADSFRVQKNGAELFFDDFTAGGPPPQAPNFLLPPPPGGSPETFYTTAGLFAEVGGKLVFNGASAAAFRGTGNNSLVVGNEAILATNTDPLNTQAGLKRNHQFMVEGVFDLVEPALVRQQYGIQLTDGVNQIADDLVVLLVRRENDGLFVRLGDNNSVLDTSSLVSSAPIPAIGADQIRLRLSHDAGAGHVTGSYELIDNDIAPGFVVGGGTLGQVGIFGTDTAFAGDDNNWIRAGLLANALDPNEFTQALAGTYGTLTVNNLGQLSYTPNAAAQTLGQGDSAVDSFFVRAIDQFGMSSAQPVDITVLGFNDGPTAVDDFVPGQVSADSKTVINALANDFDIDVGDEFRVATHDIFSFHGARITLNADGTFEYDPTNAPLLQDLASGEVRVDTFRYSLTDEIAFSGQATVQVTVVGSADDNTAPLANPDNNDTDLVVEAGITNFGLPFAGDPTAAGNVLANDIDPDAGDVLRVVDVNGVALPAGGSLTLTLTYGSLQIGANGSWTYTLNNDDPDTNALKQMMPVFAEPGFENVTYTVADAAGATDTETLSIRVNGTDDMPVAVADFNSLTESDLPVTVTGNVLANDFDPEGDPLSVFGLTVPGRYGSLTLNPNGDYFYTATPSLVNFLAGGEVVHEIFDQIYLVAANPSFGSIAQNSNTLLDIAITGTDEAPSNADGAVFEDGGRKTSGEIETTSVDLTATPVWTVVGAGPNTQVADYRYLIDHLAITRDGAAFFTDDFGNGVPPPASPANPTTGYFTTGSFQESGGRVIMDGSFAGAAGAGFVGHFATLNTDISASTTQGLKRNHAFTVEARFELVLPTEALQTYGVRLSDAGTPGGGDDIAEVSLRRLSDDTFAILLRETSVVGGQPVTLASIPFTRLPGDQQIVFTLDHAADSDVVTGSFRVLNGGAVSQSGQFLDAGGQPITANIFAGGQTFTRPQIVGLSPSHAQNGVYGTLSVDADGDWTYSLNNGIQNVQALAQDERVTDTFSVSVTDAHGASETHTVAVDVFGTNDFPSPNPIVLFPFTGGGVNGAYVVEDGTPQTARGNTFVGDLDHGPRAHFSVTANAVPGPVTPYTSDYLFRIDELKITKNGAVNLLDTFNDGVPPPSAVPGADYFVTGTFTEAGGRAILAGARAGALSGTATSELVVGNVALYNTNQRAEDTQRGFKTGHDFKAEARFDFDANFMPDAGESFGISFTDRANGEIPPNQLGDDNIYLLVLRDETGNVVAQFSERDSVSDTVSVIGSITLNAVPLGSQIVLRLEHDTADLGRLEASFDVLDGGGSLLQTGAFAEALHGEDRIFGLETPDDPSDDEGWTRFQFIATGRDTNDASVDGQYGTLSIAEDGDWTYTLNSTPGSAQWNNLQALNQGQIATESFNIRAVDAEGASNSRPLNISVIGTGEAAVPVNAVGTPGIDVLVGSTLADLITGNGGSDLLAGLAGADRYDYNNINDGTDTITDFTPGVGGDVLDIRDVLVGYTPDPAIIPFNFVQIQTASGPAGVNTTVLVNADGMGFDYVPLVTLNGVAGLFLHDLMNNGNIVLA